jgi:hypothetical protein
MSAELRKALETLAAAMERPASRIALVSGQGANDESSFVATRDGYLHLAYELVSLVMRADEFRSTGITADRNYDFDAEANAYWTDSICQAIYDFPSFKECYPVGAYLCESPEQGLALVRRLLPQEVAGWERDPQFDSPPKRQAT